MQKQLQGKYLRGSNKPCAVWTFSCLPRKTQAAYTATPLPALRAFMSATSFRTPRSDFVSSLESFLLCGSSCARSSSRCRYLHHRHTG